jgi:hypothetical protein
VGCWDCGAWGVRNSARVEPACINMHPLEIALNIAVHVVTQPSGPCVWLAGHQRTNLDTPRGILLCWLLMLHAVQPGVAGMGVIQPGAINSRYVACHGPPCCHTPGSKHWKEGQGSDGWA